MKAGDRVRYFRWVPSTGIDTAKEAVYGTVTKVEANGTVWVRVAGLGTTFLSQKDVEVMQRWNVSTAKTEWFEQGTDTMAVKITVKKASSKNSPKAAPKKERPVVGKRSIGRTLELGITDTWERVFKDNVKAKMTDEQISKFMHKEFPDSSAKDFDNVQRARRWFNAGVRREAPKVPFKRYASDGSVVEGRVMKPRAAKPSKSTPAGKKPRKSDEPVLREISRVVLKKKKA